MQFAISHGMIFGIVCLAAFGISSAIMCIMFQKANVTAIRNLRDDKELDEKPIAGYIAIGVIACAVVIVSFVGIIHVGQAIFRHIPWE
jgi:ABC-type Mn2+/Zn2+ transport system permease subunit